MNYQKIKNLSNPNKGVYGIGASSCDYNSKYPQYLRITDIDDNGYAPYTLETCINPNLYEDWYKYVLKKNDIVFARTGNSTGRNFFCKNIKPNTVFAGFLIKFSIDPALIRPQYLGYYCQSKSYWNQVSSLFTGSTRNNINAEQYGDLLIPIVDDALQQHIVNTIGTIDDLIEKNENYLFKFQQYLTNNYIESSANIKEKTELSRLIKRTGKLLKNNEWLESKIIDLSTMSSDNIFINSFSNGIDFKTNIKTVNNLDLVYGSIRPYFKKAGFALDVDYIAGSVFSFITNSPADYLWILACISSDEFHNFTTSNAQGTKMPIINWENFISFKVPYNKKIIDDFNLTVKPLFDLAINKMKQIRKIKEIKQILLSKYF